MGIGISNWLLANEVGRLGHLGVVSGTALDSVFVRRLQLGDPGGHMRRALAHFPIAGAAERIIQRYFIAGGKDPQAPFAVSPMLTVNPYRDHQELLAAANFSEVFLAKENHSGEIGINFLEKIQMALLPSLYGALLAGVDFVLMGAGIPREIPRLLDDLVIHRDVEYNLNLLDGDADEKLTTRFSPLKLLNGRSVPELSRPKFLAIISSTVLGLTLAKKIPKPVDGFVVEGPTAGGHNAPPRLKSRFNSRGEPLYGEKDEVDLKAISDLGKPFWLAGSKGSPESLEESLALGACGIQVGTAFALCEESGLEPDLKRRILKKIWNGSATVFTDASASPTGYPFKVLELEGTNSETEIYARRERRCDLGYLRQPYKTETGKIGYRCPSEPKNDYSRKFGDPADSNGRKCLCNGLMANIGLPQRLADGGLEQPLVTLGDDLTGVRRFLKANGTSFSAADVISILTAKKVETELTSPI